MITLDLLKQSLGDQTLTRTEVAYESFDKVVDFVEKEQMKQAVEIIKSSFSQGSLDIRLIFYYVYAYFLEHGIVSFQEILPLIMSLAGEHFESLFPVNKKETHFQNSVNWFFSKVLHKLKYSERLAKTGKKQPGMDKSIVKMEETQFDKFLEGVVCFQQFFYEKWPSSSAKEKVSHLVKRIEELRTFMVMEKVEEPVVVSEEGKEEEEESSEPCQLSSGGSVEQEEGGIFKSERMSLLIKKMQIFEMLVEKRDYLKAALVARDVSQLIENFNPCDYFPKLFSNYFGLVAKNVSEISEEWNQEGSLKWTYLDKLYKSDIEQFVDW